MAHYAGIVGVELPRVQFWAKRSNYSENEPLEVPLEKISTFGAVR